MNICRQHIEQLASLGDKLSGFGKDTATRRVIEEAVKANEWFTSYDIIMAVDAIRTKMLTRNALETYVESEKHLRVSSCPKDVAVIMAGNIPAVGFADLVYVVLAGDRCYVKPSSKDSVLTGYLIGELKNIAPEIPVFCYDERKYDAVIATGSDISNDYFRKRFVHTSLLARGSRYSAAVITGNESEQDIEGLAKDIFSYSGLGCRNVSLLFVPEGYEIMTLASELNEYRHDINPLLQPEYRQLRAVAIMQNGKFIDGKSFIMQESRNFSTRTGSLNYSFYETPDEVSEWLSVNGHLIQCVVTGKKIRGIRCVGFGEAQYPSLSDYADGRNVAEFLAGL